MDRMRFANRIDWAMTDANRHLEGGSPAPRGVMAEGWRAVLPSQTHRPSDFAGVEVANDDGIWAWAGCFVCVLSAFLTCAGIALLIRWLT